MSKACKYKDKCPSASGWCNIKQLDDSCFDFLKGVKDHLQNYIDTGFRPEEIKITMLEANNILKNGKEMLEENEKLNAKLNQKCNYIYDEYEETFNCTNCYINISKIAIDEIDGETFDYCPSCGFEIENVDMDGEE